MADVGVKKMDDHDQLQDQKDDDDMINVVDDDSELVIPNSLVAAIAPILGAAKEIQKENPIVAYLCRRHALQKVRDIMKNQRWIRADVRKFRNVLVSRLEMDYEGIKTRKRADIKEIMLFYRHFWEKNIKDREYREEPGEVGPFRIARILYEVLTMEFPDQIDPQTRKMAEDVKKKMDQQYEQSIAPDSELVPSSLPTSIAPILRVANEIQRKNPRVAYLCRFHVLEKVRALTMDQKWIPADIRRFKTDLSLRLKKEEVETRSVLAKKQEGIETKSMPPNKRQEGAETKSMPAKRQEGAETKTLPAKKQEGAETKRQEEAETKSVPANKRQEEEAETRIEQAKIDQKEILSFYRMFLEKNIRETMHREPDEVGKHFRTARILYEVLKTMVPPEELDLQTRKMADDVRRKMDQQDEQYNILPLKTLGAKPAIMELPEIKAAVNALCNVKDLPMPRMHLKPEDSDKQETTSLLLPGDRSKPIKDILDWLSSIFGFQKGNVANQREHLILLLANISLRSRRPEDNIQLEIKTVNQLADKILENYNSWCVYLDCQSNCRFLDASDENQQLKLVYIALYLLIWGEASNIRLMPECLCYIFHNMAKEVYVILHTNVHPVSGEAYETQARDEEFFLRNVITPMYQVLEKEAKRSKNGRESNSKWRNYDDLNEYFWSKKCFSPEWPMNPKVDFFSHFELDNKKLNEAVSERSEPKTNFVEVRTFWHLYRNFYRMWIFLTLAFQVAFIVAWNTPSGSLVPLFVANVFAKVLSVFITWAFLNFLRASLDIVLGMKAWKSLETSQIVWHLLKFAVAAFWVVVLAIGYHSSAQDQTRFQGFFVDNLSSFYNLAVAIYLVPNLLAAVLFLLPPLSRAMENSNFWIITLLMWWTREPQLYVGRGMREDMFTQMKYTLFWIILLMSKLGFSYYVEILPLVRLTKLIMEMSPDNYQWRELFPRVPYNACVVIAMWAPIILVYFMDTQIWYAIFSSLFGWIPGLFSRLGEIRTLEMLWSRFESMPLAFSLRLPPSPDKSGARRKKDPLISRRGIATFSQVWNEFINSMRLEDLISDREKNMLLVPYSSNNLSVVQWPPFLLADKISIAIDMAKDFKGKEDKDLFYRIKSDSYMYSAVIECYETLRDIIYGLLEDEVDKRVVRIICYEVDESIERGRFLNNFRMSGLPSLSERLVKLLSLLLSNEEEEEEEFGYNQLVPKIINVLQDVMEVILLDVVVNELEIMENVRTMESSRKLEQRFEIINIHLVKSNRSWMEKVIRIYFLLTGKRSSRYVPQNLEARRRLTSFANSLFMNMPAAPQVRDMLSFSVLTSYFKEDVLYTSEELNKENGDGVSMLFYLQKIYPDEWKYLEDRIHDHGNEYSEDTKSELIRQWVSYRGKTLYRTVRGLMYYRQALELQCFLEFAGNDAALFGGYGESSDQDQKLFTDRAKVLADLKFTCVISCQLYGVQMKTASARDRSCYTGIMKLMRTYPSLRVAYIDTRLELVKGRYEVYYSVLVKASESDMLDEEIYRIKLPGPPTEIGEAKAENLNHAIVFTRGEALQTIGVNQNVYFEEAFKMRNVLEEFVKSQPHCGQRKPTTLGVREHVSSKSVSSLSWFMSNQENSFSTIGQRILANPLRVRFHHGHSDIFDRIFHITRGGISKASRVINSSEEIFAGFNSTLRGGLVSHHEYIQVCTERDAGLNQISLFDASAAAGSGEQTLSRDVHRLGRGFDFYRMLSLYFTTVGFYFSSLMGVLAIYVYLYGRVYMVMSGLEREILKIPVAYRNKALQETLATQSIIQLALWMTLPTFIEISVERNFWTALHDFITKHLQLGYMFYVFQLGTKAYHYGRTITHRGRYKDRLTHTGAIVDFRTRFTENYRLYSRSHFIRGLELLILLLVCEFYGESCYARGSRVLCLLSSFSAWFLVFSWLFNPFVFNPSNFEWRNTVNDWVDWGSWIEIRGFIGITPDKSWESWWEEEHEYLKNMNFRGKLLENLLALRFLIYQYGIVYHLDMVHHNKSLLVYGLSWVFMVAALIFLKIVSIEGARYSRLRMLRSTIPKALTFLVLLSVLTDLFLLYDLTISDLFAAILAFLPTGWALVLGIGIWEPLKELARAYDYLMGVVIFMPVAALSWFAFVSEFQMRFLFHQGFSRGLQISKLFAQKGR